MMYYGDHGMSAWGWVLMTIMMIAFWGLLITLGIAAFRAVSHPHHAMGVHGVPSAPDQILAARYARGEIDENEYNTRLATLRGQDRS